MTNLEKYRSLLHDGVQGLLLTSRYSRMYAAEFDIAEGVAVVSAQGARTGSTSVRADFYATAKSTHREDPHHAVHVKL